MLALNCHYCEAPITVAVGEILGQCDNCPGFKFAGEMVVLEKRFVTVADCLKMKISLEEEQQRIWHAQGLLKDRLEQGSPMMQLFDEHNFHLNQEELRLKIVLEVLEQFTVEVRSREETVQKKKNEEENWKKLCQEKEEEVVQLQGQLSQALDYFEKLKETLQERDANNSALKEALTKEKSHSLWLAKSMDILEKEKMDLEGVVKKMKKTNLGLFDETMVLETANGKVWNLIKEGDEKIKELESEKVKLQQDLVESNYERNGIWGQFAEAEQRIQDLMRLLSRESENMETMDEVKKQRDLLKEDVIHFQGVIESQNKREAHLRGLLMDLTNKLEVSEADGKFLMNLIQEGDEIIKKMEQDVVNQKYYKKLLLSELKELKDKIRERKEKLQPFHCGDCSYRTKYPSNLEIHLADYNHQPASSAGSSGKIVSETEKKVKKLAAGFRKMKMAVEKQ